VVDDLALRDGAHYLDNGYATAGSRVATIVKNHLNATTSVANPIHMACGVPVVASSVQGATPVIPVNYATGDIGLLLVSGVGQNNYATPSGWTAVTGSPQHDSASGLNARLQAWTKTLTAGAETNPTIADVASDDAKIVVVCTIRGSSGIDTSAGNTAAASTSLTFPSLTTTVNNDLILNVTGHKTDVTVEQASAWSNTDTTGITEQFDVATSTGGGAGLAYATSVKVSSGSVSGTTATIATSATNAKLSIAFKP
jgi:hypothetical protein